MLKPIRFIASSTLSLFVMGSLFIIGTSLVRAEDAPIYERDVRPIFAAHCFRCHAEESQKAELILSSAVGVRKGGESGQVVVPGELDESLLYQLVLAGDMPPEEDQQLAPHEIAAIAKWIVGGARSTTDAHHAAAPGLTQHEVLPILYRRCVMCHGPEYQQGELDVRTQTGLLAGGVTGPALVPGKPNQSLMLARVRDRLCPPKASSGPGESHPQALTESDVNLSAHTAPIAQSRVEFQSATSRTGWVLGGQLGPASEPPVVDDGGVV